MRVARLSVQSRITSAFFTRALSFTASANSGTGMMRQWGLSLSTAMTALLALLTLTVDVV